MSAPSVPGTPPQGSRARPRLRAAAIPVLMVAFTYSLIAFGASSPASADTGLATTLDSGCKKLDSSLAGTATLAGGVAPLVNQWSTAGGTFGPGFGFLQGGASDAVTEGGTSFAATSAQFAEAGGASMLGVSTAAAVAAAFIGGVCIGTGLSHWLQTNFGWFGGTPVTPPDSGLIAADVAASSSGQVDCASFVGSPFGTGRCTGTYFRETPSDIVWASTAHNLHVFYQRGDNSEADTSGLGTTLGNTPLATNTGSNVYTALPTSVTSTLTVGPCSASGGCIAVSGTGTYATDSNGRNVFRSLVQKSTGSCANAECSVTPGSTISLFSSTTASDLGSVWGGPNTPYTGITRPSFCLSPGASSYCLAMILPVDPYTDAHGVEVQQRQTVTCWAKAGGVWSTVTNATLTPGFREKDGAPDGYGAQPCGTGQIPKEWKIELITVGPGTAKQIYDQCFSLGCTENPSVKEATAPGFIQCIEVGSPSSSCVQITDPANSANTKIGGTTGLSVATSSLTNTSVAKIAGQELDKLPSTSTTTTGSTGTTVAPTTVPVTTPAGCSLGDIGCQSSGSGPPPGDTASCWSTGWSWNPVSWVLVPIECAFKWAFIPSDADLADIKTQWGGMESTPPLQWVVGAWTMVSNSSFGFVAWSTGGPADVSVLGTTVHIRGFDNGWTPPTWVMAVVFLGIWAMVGMAVVAWL